VEPVKSGKNYDVGSMDLTLDDLQRLRVMGIYASPDNWRICF